MTQRDRTNDVTFCPRENQGQDFVQNYFRRSRNWALTTDVSAPSMAGLNAGFVCFILKAIGYSILSLRSTGRHKKTGTFEKPNKNWRNSTKHFIDRNWTITTCLLRDSNPNYQCMKITSCRWRHPLRMHSFNLPLRFTIARCNISAGTPRISSWVLCFNSSLLNGELVCSPRSLFRSAANCTWLPLRISKVPVFFLCHLVQGVATK